MLEDFDGLITIAKIYLYFAKDERSTPVEIVGKRGLVGVRIRLTDVN